MELETARLILRKFTEADYDDLYEFLSQLRDNECSWRLLEKAGLVREAHFRKNVSFIGMSMDSPNGTIQYD